MALALSTLQAVNAVGFFSAVPSLLSTCRAQDKPRPRLPAGHDKHEKAPTTTPPPAATPPTVPQAPAPTATPAAPASTEQVPEACTSTANLLHGARPTARGVTGWLPRATDDTLAEEGSFWSAPDAVVIPATSKLEYDMGKLKQVKALVVQADNNDDYVFEASTDGVAYKPLWVAPPVWEGMGLRTRWIALGEPVNARYVRITGRGGDGFFSISEVQALCTVPAIFPPKLKLPPKKYGWDGIPNDDTMVNVKGTVAALATLLLALGFSRKFYGLRLQAIGGRAALVGFFVLTTFAAAWLGGIADAGTCFASVTQWVRAIANPAPFYAAAALVGSATLGLLVYFIRARKSAALAAILISVLTFGTTLLVFLAGLASRGPAVETIAKWAKAHGSAPGFYYSAVLLFSLGLGVALLCLREQGPRLFDTKLAVIGLFSFFAWWNIGHYHFDHYVHIWEHYHYIVGAKYPELRYRRLYQCTAVADVQDGNKSRVQARKMRRIESDNRLGTSDEIIAHPELCTAAFADPQRWQQFRTDIRFFRAQFSRERWDESQNDHGYNATPVWAIIGRYLSEHVSLSWDNIVKLGAIDSAYLVAMWIAVLWAFGWRSAAVAAVYWGCNFPARFYWNGGSFLRYDWQLWMIVGICLLRKRHQFFGGAALTYATLLRVFPGFVVAAVILKALAAMVRERRIFLSRQHQAFAAGCVVALGVLIPASSWATNGVDAWPEFAVNSKKHLETALTNNMGLKTVMGYDFATRAIKMRNDKLSDPFQDWKDAKEYFYKKRTPLYIGLIVLFCALLAKAGDREEDDWVVACLGTGLIVMAAELTCYYYGFLMTYGLLWERRKLPGILAALLASVTCFIYDWVSWNDDHFAAMSLATVLCVVAATTNSAFGTRRRAESSVPPPRSQQPVRSDASASLIPEAQ